MDCPAVPAHPVVSDHPDRSEPPCMSHPFSRSRTTLPAAVPVALALCVGGVPGAHAALVNEFSASTTGTDIEYVELLAEPGADLSGLTLLEIEGDANAATGVVDEVIALGQADADGRLLVELSANTLENGSMTLLLVEGFSGTFGQDLDTDDDGVLDATPWSALLDSVAVLDDAGDLTYGPVRLGPDHDGLDDNAPGGASRIPEGVDTDTAADWVRNDFDLAGIEGYTGTPVDGEALNTPGTANARVGDAVPGGGGGGQCGDAAVPIHAIQGAGSTFDPAFGGRRSVEAVVTAVFPGLGGFHVQEEPGDEDTDPATSEGLFVYLGEDPTVTVGERVRVSGTVAEYTTSGGSSQTQIGGSPSVRSCGQATLPAPVELLLPLDAPDALEALEGMRVTLVQSLVVSEYFNFDRFGEVVLSLPPDGRDRLYTPTAVVEPGAEAVALAAEYERRRILVDDGRSTQNPDPAIHPGNGETFTLENRFRGGDLVTGLTGVVDETFGSYRVQPTVYGSYRPVNERPAAPEAVGGDVTVASLNVLNYFLGIDDGSDDCGPDLDQECRGADSGIERERQRAKLVAALVGLDADVVGLIELENTPGVSPVADLVAGLDEALGAGTYAYVDTGVIGTDVIRVGLIYRPDAVTPVGEHAVLDGGVDPRFLDGKNRPALAQTFEAGGRRFTVTVNHFKSKGSSCDDVGDPDAGDGQGNCNGVRTLAAAALADWLGTDPTGSGSDAALIIGDLNAYDREDPIDVLRAAGYVDLIALYQGELAYSYVFDGQVGYLDHALASPALWPWVTGATVWHIDADEPDILDYDVSFKRDAQDALYAPDPYRASDHDPVLVGLQLVPPTPSTAADCRRGGWRTLYRPDGSAFGNQGLCIAHVRTGR